MKCPHCGKDEDRVLDTRIQKDGEVIKRRRECLHCKSRFSTVETLQVQFPLVIKKDGRREPFSREKLLRGIQAACQKRPISLAQMENVVEIVSQWILSRLEKEVSAQIVGQKVMQELKRLDNVAYVRFASVYRTFKDVQEFLETLEGDTAEAQGDQRPPPSEVILSTTTKESLLPTEPSTESPDHAPQVP